jgi:hypothetical protein
MKGFWAWWDEHDQAWRWSGIMSKPRGEEVGHFHITYLGDDLKLAQVKMSEILESHLATKELIES